MAQAHKKRDTKDVSLLSLMRSAEDMDRMGLPPRKALMREEVLRLQKKGLTLVHREVV